MIRTAVVAGLLGLSVISAAPAMANPGVTCSYPCTIIDQTIQGYKQLPGQTTLAYEGTNPSNGFIGTTESNYQAFLGNTQLAYEGTDPSNGIIGTTESNYAALPGETQLAYEGTDPSNGFIGTTEANYARLGANTEDHLFPGLTPKP